jgi:hypothetical protein
LSVLTIVDHLVQPLHGCLDPGKSPGYGDISFKHFHDTADVTNGDLKSFVAKCGAPPESHSRFLRSKDPAASVTDHLMPPHGPALPEAA